MEYLFEVNFITEAYSKALQMDAIVWSEDDRRSNKLHSVQVTHQDGSVYVIRHVYLRYAKFKHGDLLVVYPEHMQPLVFGLGDVSSVVTFDGNEETVIHGELFDGYEDFGNDDTNDVDDENDMTLSPGMPEELREDAARELKIKKLKLKSMLYGHSMRDPIDQGHVIHEGSFDDIVDELMERLMKTKS